MPTTKNSGNSSRENDQNKKMGSQTGSSSSNNDRNRDSRSDSNSKQGGNTSKTHK